MRNLMRIVTLILIAPVAPASPRLDNLADTLARQTRSLADSAYRGFVRRDRGNRADVEALCLTEQFAAGAALLERMIRDNRPPSELRDAVDILIGQAQSAERYGFGRREWGDVRRNLDAMVRELGADSRAEPEPPGRVTGRMRWRGSVDGEVHVVVQGSSASVRLLSGQAPPQPAVAFISPLPQRAVAVQLVNVRGRGSIEVMQHPSRNNDYTAVIQIRDSKGGAGDYEFELVW
jgi:hypothetical protein